MVYFVNLCRILNSPKSAAIIQLRWQSTTRKHIDKILIANRGEIACRVIRTAKKLGVKTVAVYSDADRDALHVAMADEAYNIGPPAASRSYLLGDKIIQVAKKANCLAIHPGYGFLSENVEFAESCQKSDVIFIGPPASAIRDMGIKSTSKAIMQAAGVPIIEGYHGQDQNNERLKQEAIKIGFPVMIKAVRGGGGKGMRIANSEQEFDEALESARSESQKAFSDSDVLLEKFVGEPRHVEVQVFADTHGNAVHLFERDCSVQRRCQKIIEEAPAPGLSEMLRQDLGAAAVRAAKAVGYVGAGTVEFILDKNTHSFHFMEMNTRLQVEHPITEMITGTDLVEWQIRVASGETLPLTQEEIKRRGHSFEARIYAEDPSGGFLPGAGPLLHLTVPEASEDTRIETGVRQGDEVSVHYDPMIAKLVVWGNNRSEALAKLKSRLLEYNIAGLETNVNFLIDLAKHPEFAAGNVHTNFIRDYHDSLFKQEPLNDVTLVQAALAFVLKEKSEEFDRAVENKDQYNPFIVEASFRVNYEHQRKIVLKFKDQDIQLLVRFLRDGGYKISCDDGKTWYSVEGELTKMGDKITLRSSINSATYKCHMYKNDEMLAIFNENGKIEFNIPLPKYLTQEDDSSSSSSNKAVSPMPGVLDKIVVNPGDQVKKGDTLFVIIAMKMEYAVKATKDVTISDVFYKAGDNVPKDAIVVQFATVEED